MGRWRRLPNALLDDVRLRVVASLVVASAIGFGAVSVAAVIVARRIALSSALAEASRTARTIGNVVFAPSVPGVLAGDASAIRRLDEAVADRRLGGALVRVKVWSRDGHVLYSDDHNLIGRHFAANPEVRTAIVSNRTQASVSNLDDAENVDEDIGANGRFHRLVEVYLPLRLDDGNVVVFETYSSDARLLAAERGLRNKLVPFALVSLLTLLLLWLPVAVWLINHMYRAQQDRSRLLVNLLRTSGRERRRIAEELHDGVVQKLAGSGYALSAALRRLPDDTDSRTRTALALVLDNVQQSADDLRNIIVDVRPSDLTATGLIAAITVQADRARACGIDVHVDSSLRSEPDPRIAATIYRGAREGILNVLKHARATRIDIHVVQQGSRVRLEVLDDGQASPARSYVEAPDGHVGLTLLHSAAEDGGGELRVSPRPSGGTALVLDVPLRP